MRWADNIKRDAGLNWYSIAQKNIKEPISFVWKMAEKKKKGVTALTNYAKKSYARSAILSFWQ